MKATITVEKEVDFRTLHVSAGVRYWMDSEVNGESDTDSGDNIPCKEGDCWKPVIDLESGVIKNWEKGKTASVHYKVCDQCGWLLEDKDGEYYAETHNEYVPKILCPKENGYGDYIIMDIDENGKIKNWKPLINDLFK
jgi:hypothetical protein